VETLLQEVRLAARSLARNPVLTGAAVLCLALGIGPNTAVFSIVDAVLLRPLPYENPEQVVLVWGQFVEQGQPKTPISPPELRDLVEQVESFEHLAAVGPQLVNITGETEPERLVAARASEGIFRMLGVEGVAGRLFAAEDHRADAAAVAVLSNDLWRRRFGSDPGVIHQVVRLNGRPTEVIGVLPAEFRFGSFEYDVWLPMLDNPNPPPRAARFLTVVGRLKDGVTIGEARAELRLVAGRLQRRHPEAYPEGSGWGLTAVSAHEDLVGDVQRILLVLGLTVGFVLVIACANVANLLLARAAARKKEVAIRTALGAGRRDLVRQFLTESVMLSLLAAVLGVLLAWGVIRWLVTVHADALPRTGEIGLDWRVLLFTLLVAVVTGVVFGLVPVAQTLKFDLRETLTSGGKTSNLGGSGGRLRAGLVIAEVALALVVLIGGSLVIKSFSHLLQIDPGYRPDNVLSLQLTISRLDRPEDHQVVAFFRDLVGRLETIPGVRSAAVISHLPASSFELSGDVVPEGWAEGSGRPKPSTGWRIISPDYFQAMGIPLLEGRAFRAEDDGESPEVVVVDRDLAQRLWPGERAVGKRLKIESTRPDGQGWREVVGVVGHVRQLLTGGGSPDQLYLPQAQHPVRITSVVVRTQGDPELMVPQVRSAIADLDPDLPVEDVRPMSRRLEESIAQPRLTTVLFGSFALIALLLAVVGVYGVIAYATAQRGREIGIRMTLGARRSEVIRTVLVSGLRLAGIGLAVGLAGALALNRLLSGFLFGVSSTDAPTYALASTALVAMAAIACLLPAWRASRIDPARTLRAE